MKGQVSKTSKGYMAYKCLKVLHKEADDNSYFTFITFKVWHLDESESVPSRITENQAWNLARPMLAPIWQSLRISGRFGLTQAEVENKRRARLSNRSVDDSQWIECERIFNHLLI